MLFRHKLDRTEKNFNFLVFTMIIIAFFGCIFIAIQGVSSGFTTAILLLGGVATISLIGVFIKDDENLKPITNFIGIPLSARLPLTCFLYLIGLLIPFLLKVIFDGLFKLGFSFTSFSIPLFGGDITSNFQSFAVSQIAGSEAWKEFIMVYVAGTNETFLFNYAVVIGMVLIGMLLFELLTDNKKYIFGIMPKSVFVIGFSFLATSGIFTILHTMNATYDSPAKYIGAFLFLLFANISIYLGGVWMSFWIGWHQMNNLIYLVEVDGFKQVAIGMFSFFGVIFVGSIVLILFYVLRNYKAVLKDLMWWTH